jgi:hypothetical protein
MPTSIPYDSSLVLGNLISDSKIDALKKIKDDQAPVDAAQNKLNGLIQAKYKMDMTLQEMVNMNVDPDQLSTFRQSIEKLQGDIATAASDYGTKVITMYSATGGETGADPKIEEMPESPIDWNKSALKQMALSSDSMNTDVQYVRNESEVDSNDAHASAVAASASATVGSIFGPSYTASTAAAVKSTVLKQTQNHKVAGTLVITACCTHKIAEVFAPFVMDPEKAVSAWNKLYGKDDYIDVTKQDSLESAIEEDNKGTQEKGKVLSLLSGQTMGSSFIGMVHVLQVEKTNSSQSSSSVSAAAEAQMEWGGFFAHGSGKFGVDSEFSNNIKNLLSSSDLTSHCSLITMGLIPTLKSNNLKTSISQLAPDAKEVMGQLAAIQGATDTDVNSAMSSANKAKTGQQFIELNNSYISSVVSNVSKIDNDNNKVIDTNSLMTAFDDYVQKAGQGNCGVPINFFVREITKSMIAKAWLKKFSPLSNWQLTSSDDNSKPADEEKTDG